MVAAASLRRWAPLAALVAGAAALGAWLAIDPRATDDAQHAERLLPDFHADAVDHITVERRGEFVYLHKHPHYGWEAVLPRRTARRADEAAMHRLLRALEFASIARHVTTLPSAAGLSPPRACADVQSIHLCIGADDALGGGVYVERDHQRFVSDAQLVDVLDLPLEHWVSAAPPDAGAPLPRKLFLLDPAFVNSLDITRGGRTISLLRTAEGWRADGAPADDGEVRATLDALAAVDGPSLVPVTPFPIVARVVARAEGSAAVRLVARGSGVPHVCMAPEDGGSCVFAETSLLERLSSDPLAWRPRRVLSLRAADIRHLVVGEIALEPTAGAWHLTHPQGKLLDNDHLVRLLATLAELRATRFLPDATPVSPTTRIAIDAITLIVGERSEAGCRARLGDSVFDLAPSTCADLLAPLIRAE